MYYQRPVFEDRLDAGRRLAQKLVRYRGQDVVVLAIPRGGVPVGFAVAKELGAKLDVIIPRKIPIPDNPEAGFGAVTADGTVVLNEPLVAQLGLTRDTIERLVDEVRAEIVRRQQAYRGGRPPADLAGKTVILVDDGLASGYTMMAAIQSVRKQRPKAIIVAVPVSPADAAERIRPLVDDLVVLVVRRTWVFAVASFYRRWYDLTDEEVIDYLKRAAGEDATGGPTSGRS